MKSVFSPEKSIPEVFKSEDIRAMSPIAQKFAKILESEGWIRIQGGKA